MLLMASFLALLLLFQDSSLDRLLENLGSESPEIREAASQGILELGVSSPRNPFRFMQV
jgi:hypothetical protein